MEKYTVKVLLVDDIEANLISFHAILRKLDIKIYEASSGNEALKIIMKENIDIVLLDVQMPDINGFEVAKLIRANPSTLSIPIIFITASNQNDDYMFKGYELGCVDYLYKPINSELLKSKVEVFVKMQLQTKIIEFKSNELEKKIIELERVEEELFKVTCTDQLTGIKNRRGFADILDSTFRRAIRNSSSISLLMLDVDNFKNFNDEYGHPEGDVCLQKVARSIDDTLLRPYDVVARYGGEEFVVILPETDLEGSFRVAEEIRGNIEDMHIQNSIDGKIGNLTVSVGIASIVPVSDDEKDKLLQWADESMYIAKEEGRNRCCKHEN